MSDFLRKLVALSACITLAELLLPQGDIRQAARLVLTLLVTLLLTTTLLELLSRARLSPQPEAPAAVLQAALEEVDTQADERYRQTVLSAWANQLAERCERLCASAGYRVEAVAYLLPNGAAHHVELRLLSKEETPLYAPALLPERLCQTLALEPGQVCWQAPQEAVAP